MDVHGSTTPDQFVERKPTQLATFRPNRNRKGVPRREHRPQPCFKQINDVEARNAPAPTPVAAPAQARRMKLSHKVLAEKPDRVLDFGHRPVHIWIGNWLGYFRQDGVGHTEHLYEAGTWPPDVAYKMAQQKDPKHTQGYVLVVAR